MNELPMDMNLEESELATFSCLSLILALFLLFRKLENLTGDPEITEIRERLLRRQIDRIRRVLDENCRDMGINFQDPSLSLTSTLELIQAHSKGLLEELTSFTEGFLREIRQLCDQSRRDLRGKVHFRQRQILKSWIDTINEEINDRDKSKK
jgi:hypothetical protein